MELLKQYKKPNVKITQYENLFVGFEFEFEGVTAQQIENTLNIKYGQHNRGRSEKVHVIERDGIKVEVPILVDKYKESDIVVEAYRDGSVEHEVVTRPVQLKKLQEVKGVHKKLSDLGVDFVCNGKAGLHITFLQDPHKEFSSFEPIVVKNLMQLVRAFYKDIVVEFTNGRKTRSTYYRQIPTKSEVDTLRTQHYTAVSLRRDNNGNIWGIEIRIPDGTKNWELIERQVKFWSAVIRHAAIISRYGLISFEQEVWDLNKQFYMSLTGTSSLHSVSKNNKTNLFNILDNSLRFYGYYSESETEEDYEIKSKIVEHLLNGSKLSEIRKTVGYDKKKVKFERIEKNLR